MKVLIVNAGSSSLKYQLVDMDNEQMIVKGQVERIAIEGSHLNQKTPDMSKVIDLYEPIPDHVVATKLMLRALLDPEKGVLKSVDEIGAVGHRVLHGGEEFTASCIITDEVKAAIRKFIPLGPLHNPANLMGIEACEEVMPHTPQVAVFDTAFHQTMPEESYLYALPYSLYKEHGVRRYGAHGTSHFYVTQEAAKVLNKPVEELNIITCHLGNGGSVSAIRNGKCVDTSMGLTPLEGLVMGTRSGDIDPAIIFHLHDALGMSVDAINKMLTKESGLLGLTEVTSDCRYVEDNYQEKADAKRAMDVYCHRLAKYIGSYTALMDGRLDAVVFTGGIGENAAMVRELSLGKLGVLGFEVDHERNLAARFGKSGFINKEGTRPAIVIPTNEELVIAQDANRLTA